MFVSKFGGGVSFGEYLGEIGSEEISLITCIFPPQAVVRQGKGPRPKGGGGGISSKKLADFAFSEKRIWSTNAGYA